MHLEMKANAVLLRSCGKLPAARRAATVRRFVSGRPEYFGEMNGFQFEQIGVIRSPMKNSPFAPAQWSKAPAANCI